MSKFELKKKLSKVLNEINWRDKVKELYNQLIKWSRKNSKNENFLNFNELKSKEETKNHLTSLIKNLKRKNLLNHNKISFNQNDNKLLNKSNKLAENQFFDLQEKNRVLFNLNDFQKEFNEDQKLNFFYYSLYIKSILELQRLRKIWALEKNHKKSFIEANQISSTSLVEPLNYLNSFYEKEEFIKGKIKEIYPHIQRYKSLSIGSVSSQMSRSFNKRKTAFRKSIIPKRIIRTKITTRTKIKKAR